MKIKTITEVDYNGYVHNVEVADNHNYFCNGVLVSNCHENSTKDGLHGDIMNLEFIDRLHPFTELAIGGGNPLEHPDLTSFLEKCKKLKLIPSMTINQTHLQKNLDFVNYLVDNKLIYGLGISVMHIDDKFIEQVKQFPNAVLHIIAGLINIEDLKKLSDNNFKILILGYKVFRRGADLYKKLSDEIEAKISILKNNLVNILDENWFGVVSFDNLAIKQLCVKDILSTKEWNEFYMGDDGAATMYADLVEKKFARSSTAVDRYDLMSDIKDMFKIVRTT